MVTVRRAGERATEQVGGLSFPPGTKEVIHAQTFCISMVSQGKGRLRFGKKSAVKINNGGRLYCFSIVYFLPYVTSLNLLR